MNSTKMMLLGILIMLLGLALDSGTARLVEFRSVDHVVVADIAQIAGTLSVVGFVVGVVGFFRR